MATKHMQVLLKQDVQGFGKKGEVKQAAAGYARNFLLPKAIAVEATKDIVAQAEAATARATKKAASSKADAERVLEKFKGAVVTIRVKAGDKGKLFGSVTKNDVADAIKRQLSVELPDQALTLEPIKTLGKHEVAVKLAPEVTGTVTVQVESNKS